MSKACPLLFRQIDATLTKLNAAIVLTGIVFYLITLNVWIIVHLMVDFITRLSGYRQYSMVNQTASAIQALFQLQAHMEDAGGKRLAAIFGLLFMIGIIVGHLLGWTYMTWFFSFTFAVCALLDIIFDYCIACILYAYLKKIYPKGFE